MFILSSFTDLKFKNEKFSIQTDSVQTQAANPPKITIVTTQNYIIRNAIRIVPHSNPSSKLKQKQKLTSRKLEFQRINSKIKYFVIYF